MLKIVALNDKNEDKPNEDEELAATREAQETIAENEFVRAIKLKAEGDVQLCLFLLKQLLQTKVLNENIKNNRGDKLWTIKYNCHKNIALILEQRYEYMLALQHYISAILIDSTDVSTTYKFGQLALKLNATDLAEYAFENCIRRNSAHWLAANGMLQTMNVNHNIIGVYLYSRQIFKKKMDHKNAKQILQEITNLFKNNLSFLKKCSGIKMNPLIDKELNKSNRNQLRYLINEKKTFAKKEESFFHQLPDLTKFYIKETNWHSIGQFIVCAYSHLSKIKHDMLFVFKFNDIFINSDVRVGILPNNICENLETKSANYTKVQDGFPEQYSALKSKDYSVGQEKSSTSEKMYTPSIDYNNYDSDSNAKLDVPETIKVKPRRRCSDLHFLEQWGWHKNRRYSSRKKNERDDVDSTLNGYLRKILIQFTNIPIDDKWPFGKIAKYDKEFNNDCQECITPVSEDSFNLKTKQLIEDLIKCLKEKHIDLMELTYKWLKYISLGWFLPIPKKLSTLYTDLFEIYMSHFNFSTWNQLTPSNFEASYRICILYLEISAKNYLSCNSFSDLWRTVFQHLLFNIGNCHITSAEFFEIFQLKLIFLEYLVHNREHHNKECVFCLQQMIDILEQHQPSFILHSPNLNVCININYVKNLQLKYEREIDVLNIPTLYEKGSWEILTNMIIANIECTDNNYHNQFWLNDICVQIQILLESFWNMTSYENCLKWSEKCFHYAALHYLQESKTSYRCSLLAQLINFTTSYIEAIILNEGFHIVAALNKENVSRMVHNVIRILVYQFDGTFEKNSNHGQEINFKRLWVILHQIILREENDSRNIVNTPTDNIKDVNELIPKSFMILFTAHEYLGKRQWCTNDNGEFLQYVLDAVVLNLKAPIYDACRDVLYEHIEQVTYCLFKYPQKKARLRHLEDHEANQIKLCWQKAVQLFDLYRPEDLPEFNSYKLDSITSDMEQLILKLILLMPKELDPSTYVHHITMFIAGCCQSPPSESNALKLPYKILALYYLLADFYFKNRDFVKAIKFYTLDLTVNPTRFDSWAGMALSKASKIETKINCLDPLSMEAIWKECEEVLRCFECCINLNRFQTLLWIEYGSFSYTIHSCFSRYIKTNLKNMSVEPLSIINERKTKMLTIAYNCFSFANSLQNSTSSYSNEDNSDANDEKWLCQYMLGKISEKRKEEPKVYLNHYLMAANYLYENSATYPIKINHSNPTTLSVESLEVFYRINAAIIKYLHGEKEIKRCTGDLFNKILKNLSNSPFAYNKAKIDGNCLNILKGKYIRKLKSSSSNTIKQDNLLSTVLSSNLDSVKLTKHKKGCFKTSSIVSFINSSTSLISSDASTVESESDSDDSLNENVNNTLNSSGVFTAEELNVVYRTVVQNLEECVTRFPEHYKSIYRLTYHYMNSEAEYCDHTRSEQLLLGQYKTSLGNLVNGLFYDKKNNNLFNGIWRIPSSEIDRPGSFSSHLVKCVKICIQFLYKTNNYRTLIDIATNLYKTPEFDKRYILDAERVELCQQSINYAVKILRSNFKNNADKADDKGILNLLIDIYKIHKKCIKYMNQKELMFVELLVDVYKFFIIGKVAYVPDNCNFLDLAIKLCVQEMAGQKNIEKSVYNDSATHKSDSIVAHSSIIPKLPNAAVSRIINIPGLCTLPKYEAGISKAPPTTTSQLSTQNTSGNLAVESLSTKNTLEFQKLFKEFYSKISHNEIKVDGSTSLISRSPVNQLRDFTFSENVLIGTTSMISPNNNVIQETSFNSTNVDDRCSTFSSDVLLNSQTRTLKELPKKTYKNKPIFKPYNRSINSECSQNYLNDLSNKYIIDLFSNNANALSTYSNFLHNEKLPQMDLNEKFLDVCTNNLKVELPATAATNHLLNISKKDFQKETTQLNPNIQSTMQFQNPFSCGQYTNFPNVASPTKTLQEKLADRQKSYQSKESKSIFECTKNESNDDVIVLD